MPRTPKKTVLQKAAEIDQKHMPKRVKCFQAVITLSISNLIWKAYEDYARDKLDVPSPRLLIDGDFRFVLNVSKILYMYRETENLLCVRTRDLFFKLTIN